MMFIISYCILFSLLFFGLFSVIYNHKVKKGTFTQKCALYWLPPVIGVMNSVFGAYFLHIYFANPAAFSSEQTISSSVVYILFSVFCCYLYLAAFPLSIGFVGICIRQYRKQHMNRTKCIFSVITNLTGAIFILILSCQVFG